MYDGQPQAQDGLVAPTAASPTSPLEVLMNSVRQQERVDGVRFVWNYWPASRTDEGRLIVPLAVFYTPAKPRPDLPALTYDPLYCGKCRGILNPFCKADLRTKLWTCCFCSHRNGFPLSYTGISERQYPAEMTSHFSTIEYTLPRPAMAPIMLFVVDTCIDSDELEALKETLLKCVAALTKSTFVGLITFGRNVSVHDFGTSAIKHSFVFRGTKYLNPKQLAAHLGIGRYGSHPQEPTQGDGTIMRSAVSNRFLQPFETCEQRFVDSVKSISKDPWSTPAGRRALRCTGAALNTAVSLLETSFPGAGGRVVLFLGGPCTEGPGKVVGEDLKVPIRSHMDIAKGNAPFTQSYYTELSTRAVSNGHSIDIFSCALDQTGLHEMKSCCNTTGGQLVLADSFGSTLFSQNLDLLFALSDGEKLQVSMNASIEVKASRNIKVSGCLGPCVSEKTANEELVSDVSVMGTGGTTTWKCCSLTPNTTMCFFYETTGHDIPLNVNDQLYLQFITSYQHPSSQRRIRVTTVARSWVDHKGQNVGAGFDQEAAAIVLARLAVAKLEAESNGVDVQRWLDKSLIKLCNRFGSFNKDDPNSFCLSDHFAHFPAMIFHLRRSQLLQLSNTSPDESAFYRHCLSKQDVTTCLIMIQPVLYAYSLSGPPTLVTLDSRSLLPDRILLLDTFFHIVIYRGQTIMQWVQAGYDRMPEYANLAHLIQAPMEDAELVLSTRFPMPRYVLTEQDGSQARFLLSKVNPSQTQSSYAFACSSGQSPDTTSVLTEDVSLQVFIEHLRKLAVSSSL